MARGPCLSSSIVVLALLVHCGSATRVRARSHATAQGGYETASSSSAETVTVTSKSILVKFKSNMTDGSAAKSCSGEHEHTEAFPSGGQDGGVASRSGYSRTSDSDEEEPETPAATDDDWLLRGTSGRRAGPFRGDSEAEKAATDNYWLLRGTAGRGAGPYRGDTEAEEPAMPPATDNYWLLRGTSGRGAGPFREDPKAEEPAMPPATDDDWLLRGTSGRREKPSGEDAELTEEPAEEPSEPPMEWVDLLEEEVDDQGSCEENEFRVIAEADRCEACDPQCLPARCIDGLGCVSCSAGYYYVRPGVGLPFECRECLIPHCTHCHSGATYVGRRPKCIQCEDGYRPSSDSLNCEPLLQHPSISGSEGTFSHAVDVSLQSSTSETESTEEQTDEQESLCGANHFMDGDAGSCVPCDLHSIEGGCRDYIGCLSCMDGFFRRRSSLNSPFVCYACTVANCAECVDDIPFTTPPQCKTCEEGFQIDPHTQLCTPVP